MADYYLCGWGQVLHAVVPAGVREKAGTREATFVEAVPRESLPDPVPTVTPKQKQALEKLRMESEPVELGAFAKAIGVGTGVVAGLITKGLVRKYSERIERKFPSPLEGEGLGVRGGPVAGNANHQSGYNPSPLTPLPQGERGAGIILNPDQEKAWNTILPALSANEFKPYLLHGITGSGKTGNLLAGDRGSGEAGKGSDRSRARNLAGRPNDRAVAAAAAAVGWRGLSIRT